MKWRIFNRKWECNFRRKEGKHEENKNKKNKNKKLNIYESSNKDIYAQVTDCFNSFLNKF